MQISHDFAGSLPQLWSAEEPHLYVLVLSLLAADGSWIESESCQVQAPECDHFLVHNERNQYCAQTTKCRLPCSSRELAGQRMSWSADFSTHAGGLPHSGGLQSPAAG